VSLTADLLKDFEPHISSLQLIPSKGGVFEVVANGRLVFSKKALGRHAEPGEISKLIEEQIKA
jgi:selenoprotein W-related protein